MLENKLNLVLIKDLPSDLKISKTVKSRQLASIYSIIVLATLFLFVDKLYIVSIFLIALLVFIFVKTPDNKIIDICEDRIILYIKDNDEYCQMILYSEINEWALKQERSRGDQLWFSDRKSVV